MLHPLERGKKSLVGVAIGQAMPVAPRLPLFFAGGLDGVGSRALCDIQISVDVDIVREIEQLVLGNHCVDA